MDQRFERRTGGPIGRAAEATSGRTLSDDVAAFCEDIFADGGAVLCGPGGGRFVYDLRRRFDLFCKISPLRPLDPLSHAGRLKVAALAGTDVLILRENVGGVYQGEWSEAAHPDDGRVCEHRFRYSERQVRRFLETAAAIAARRRGRLAIVIKEGGIPGISGLWREIGSEAASRAGVDAAFPDIDLIAYRLIQEPRDFDVIAAPNLFRRHPRGPGRRPARFAGRVVFRQLLAGRRRRLSDEPRLGARSRGARPRESDRTDPVARDGPAGELRPCPRGGLDRGRRLRRAASRLPHLRHRRGGHDARRNGGDGRAHRRGGRATDVRPRGNDAAPSPRGSAERLSLGRRPRARSGRDRAPRGVALSSRRARAGWPVAHAVTSVDPRADTRMPHWKARGVWKCVRGTEGAAPPASLRPPRGSRSSRRRSSARSRRRASTERSRRRGPTRCSWPASTCTGACGPRSSTPTRAGSRSGSPRMRWEATIPCTAR